MIGRWTQPAHPLLLICAQIRELSMHHVGRSEELPIRNDLLIQMRKGKAGSLALLLLVFDFRYRRSIDADEVLEVVRQAWHTEVSIIRLEALDLVHSVASVIREAGADAEVRTIELLESFDVEPISHSRPSGWIHGRASRALIVERA